MDNIYIEGLSELLRQMNLFPKSVADNYVRAAMVPAAQLIRNAAQNIAVRRTGLLASAIHIGFHPSESGPWEKVYHIFVSRKVKKLYPKGKDTGRTDKYAGKVIDPFYFHMIEKGTVKKGARPFLRPAFDSSVNKAVDIIADKLGKSIDEEIARTSR